MKYIILSLLFSFLYADSNILYRFGGGLSEYNGNNDQSNGYMLLGGMRSSFFNKDLVLDLDADFQFTQSKSDLLIGSFNNAEHKSYNFILGASPKFKFSNIALGPKVGYYIDGLRVSTEEDPSFVYGAEVNIPVFNHSHTSLSYERDNEFQSIKLMINIPFSSPQKTTVATMPECDKYEYELYYNFDTYTLNESSIKTLTYIRKNHIKATSFVVGYADNRGSSDYNLELSKKRADRIARHLKTSTQLYKGESEATGNHGLDRKVYIEVKECR